MPDKRKNNGGHSTKPKNKNDARLRTKAEERALIEKLTPLEDTAHEKLRENLELGEQWAVKMFFEYMYGKPTMGVDLTSKGDKLSGFKVIIEDE